MNQNVVKIVQFTFEDGVSQFDFTCPFRSTVLVQYFTLTEMKESILVVELNFSKKSNNLADKSVNKLHKIVS